MAYKYTGRDLRARHVLACVTFDEERDKVWTVETELQARVIELLEIYTRQHSPNYDILRHLSDVQIHPE